MTVATQTPDLLLGSLDLMMTTPDPTYGFLIEALAENFGTGDPEAVIASILSQLQDGDAERIDRFGNRSATIPLVISAPNSLAPGDAIARGQAAIDNAIPDDGSWTTLSWTSPLKGALTSVFEVTSATVSTTKDDLGEMVEGCRYVTLTIHARPFVRPTTPVTIAAQAVVGNTTTTVDDGSSTTNWSLLTPQPPAYTNLVPNPSFETNTTGWSPAYNISGLARTTWPGQTVGTYYMYGQSVGAGTAYIGGPTMAITAGTSYLVLAYMTGEGDSYGARRQVGMMVRFYNSSSAQVGSDMVSGTVDVGSSDTSFKPLGYTVTAPAGAVSMQVFPFIQAQAGGDLLGLDEVCVVKSGWNAPAFDGATASTTSITYAWTGTAHASTSTATPNARTLAVSSGMVKGTVYASDVAAIRRTGAISMSSLPYMKITGVMSVTGSHGPYAAHLTIADGGTDISSSVVSFALNGSTGEFTVLLNRPTGITTSLDIGVSWTPTGTTVTDPNDYASIAVDAIVITDNPYGTAAVQVQNISVLGSQRTDVSLLVQGLDSAGTTAVGLGNETLVYTATAGTDGRAKFGAARSLAARAGTTDSTATSGSYDTLGSTSSPTTFAFAASKLLPGNYLIFARIKAPSTTVGDLISFKSAVTPAVGDNVYDPRTGWKTAPITAVSSGAVWPQVNTGTWTIVPLGMLRLPPADVLQDTGAQVTISVAKGSTAVTLDDLFLCNADVGQASLVLTSYGSSSSFSAVRLDAATVLSPQALCYVGSAKVGSGTPSFLADPGRWFGEQHKALPGLLQIATVTPGCTTARVSGSYYPRFHTDVAATP